VDIIKSGRISYDLVDGDTVMDNGACYQLTSRTIAKGFRNPSPQLTKTEFNKFIAMNNVTEEKNHDYGSGVVFYVYSTN
jgi:hypothetical protein